ncbi:MAG: Tfp pilus assembly protein FimT/FimU [Acidobacteriota bacterium]
MRPPRQAGFTLVELILVIVVMGLLAGVAVPRLMNNRSQDEVSTRDELKATLRLARQVAVSRNRDVCFMRTPAQFSLVYLNAGACALGGAAVLEPGTGQPHVVPLPSGVVLAGAATIRFNSRGQLVPNGANLQITVGALPALTISRETGFVY